MAESGRPPGPGSSGSYTVEPIESRHRWNGLVAGLPNSALEQAWGWGEVLRDSGADPHRYAVFADDRCVAAMAMLSWRLPALGVSVLYAPRGPLVETKWPTAWAGIVDAARVAAGMAGAICLRVSPGVQVDRCDFHDDLIRHGFTPLRDDWTTWNAPKIVMALSLEGPERAMWHRISNRRRREIRAAEAAGVRVTHGTSSEDVAAFHRLVITMGERKRYPVRRLEYFRALWREYENGGVLGLAHHQGRLIGGLLGASFGGVGYLLYVAVERAGPGGAPAARPGPLLYWHFLQWAKAAGCHAVHWGGSGTRLPPEQRDRGYGVYQFKRSFGSSCFAYLGYYDLVFRPVLYRAFRLAERTIGPMLWRVRSRLNRYV